MIKSEELNLLAPALARAQNQLRVIVHDSINPRFESGYATLQTVVKEALPVLEENKLAITQTFDGGDAEHINIETILIHGSGQFIGSNLKIPARPIKKKDEKEPGLANAQSVGSAITYGRRYAMIAILGIATDKDDDGNSASFTSSLSAKPTKLPTTPAEPEYKQTEDNEFGGEEPATLEQVAKLRTYSEVPTCKPFIQRALAAGRYGSLEQLTTEEADICIKECQQEMNKVDGDEPDEPVKSRKTCPKELKYLEKWLTGHEATINKFYISKNYIKPGQTWRDLEEHSIQRLADNPDGFAAAVDLPEPPSNPY